MDKSEYNKAPFISVCPGIFLSGLDGLPTKTKYDRISKINQSLVRSTSYGVSMADWRQLAGIGRILLPRKCSLSGSDQSDLAISMDEGISQGEKPDNG